MSMSVGSMTFPDWHESDKTGIKHVKVATTVATHGDFPQLFTIIC